MDTYIVGKIAEFGRNRMLGLKPLRSLAYSVFASLDAQADLAVLRQVCNEIDCPFFTDALKWTL